MKFITALALIIGLTACAPKGYSVEIQKLYNEQSLTQAIGILQDAAIQADASGVITTDEGRLVITFTNTALKSLRDKKSGWKVVISNDLKNVAKNVRLNSKFSTSFTLIETILDRLSDG